MEGNLEVNDKLTKATYLGYKKLAGPETIVFNEKGELFTGLLNGQIARIDENGNVHNIIRMGDETNEEICSNYGQNLISNPKCGRPLGIRFEPGTNLLYVADSYLGLFKVDLEKSKKT
jgi:hypothetical protein